MNVIGELIHGENVVIWGSATEPKTKTLPSGKTVTEFQLAIGKNKEDGNKIFIKVQAWEILAKHFASYIDKGDFIKVTGTCFRDDYWSERNQRDTYMVMAGFIENQVLHGIDQGLSGFGDDDMMNLP